MTPNGRPRRRPEAPSLAPTTLTECARRYHGAALTLARSFGLPLTEDFLQAYHAAIAAVYIEAGKAGVRLSEAVKLPALIVDATVGTTNGQEDPSDHHDDGPITAEHPESLPQHAGGSEALEAHGQGERTDLTADHHEQKSDTTQAPPLLTIPVGLPCAGQLITALKPAPLAMLLARAANLVHEQGAQWVPLLGSLQVERAQRLERGKRRNGEGPQG